MKKIMVKDLFLSAFSESKALILRKEIQKILDKNESVTIDFSEISKFTTLFFNFSTGYFVSTLGPEEYDKRIFVEGLSELGRSTYNSSYENTIKKYDPKEREELLSIIENPED